MMKSLKSLSIILLCLLTACSSKYEYEEVNGDPTKTRIYTLENGLKVYLSVNKETPRIQTYIAVRTGSKNDPAETTGLAHYLEHLMFKGTGKFGVTDSTKEAPLLADIEQRYEAYRKLTDPAQRRQAYHEIDSVSQLAAKYFIPNEYDKLMASHRRRRHQCLYLQRRDLLYGGHPCQRGGELGKDPVRPLPEHGYKGFPHGA